MRKLTTEEFIEKAKEVHGDRYDYSLSEYNVRFDLIKIICPEHGEFEQLAGNHLVGKGCRICADNVKPTADGFAIKAKKVHGDKYDYSLVEYTNNRTKVKIICPEHGEFEKTPTSHLNGSGCQKCNGIKTAIRCSQTLDHFIMRSKQAHGDKYDYSKSEYKTSRNKIIIICPKHGEFTQRAGHHMDGIECPHCKSSKGEVIIKNILLDQDIKFKQQHTFKGCRNVVPLRFDFYLPDHNTCVEFNGRQHYSPVSCFGGKESFELQKKKDKIKVDYCRENGIELLVIRFDECIKTKMETIFSSHFLASIL